MVAMEKTTAEAFNGVANYNYTWTNGSTSISNAIASNLTSDTIRLRLKMVMAVSSL